MTTARTVAVSSRPVFFIILLLLLLLLDDLRVLLPSTPKPTKRSQKVEGHVALDGGKSEGVYHRVYLSVQAAST